MRGEEYMSKLEGKIALITGGNSGIGLATAQQFVNEGAYVFITGRREPELARAVKEIGRNVTGVQGDVSSLVDLDRLFAQIKREKGKLDIVFANAGTFAKVAPLGKITEEHFDSPSKTLLEISNSGNLPALMRRISRKNAQKAWFQGRGSPSARQPLIEDWPCSV